MWWKRIENQTLLAIFLAILFGLIFPEVKTFEVLGQIFLRLLKMVVLPLVFTSVFVSLAGMGTLRAFERLGFLSLIYYLFTTALAVITGLVLVHLLHPAAYLSSLAAPKLNPLSLQDLLLELFPENMVRSFAEDRIIPVLFLGLVLGGACLHTGEKGEPLKVLLESLNETLLTLTRGIIRLTPVGVFFLVAPLVAREGLQPLLDLGHYVATVILGLSLHALFTLPLLLRLLARVSPWRYFLAVREAPFLAFSTASSSATLPVTLEVAEERGGVRREVAGFVLPLGATVNMDGTALYEAVAAMFMAFSYGLTPGIKESLLVFLTAVLASVGAAGIPGAGLVTMTLVLQSIGLPLEGLGLILAVDRFLDMLRTSVNVWGDLVGAKIIDRALSPQGG
ncbi:dicarboxylate/amino acid:cation symporter [Thermosulfurimonas marina]|uniref:Dicarboxylate/amino acid:cation symporter n=1 Tax=Thermosulfurimonas marina TaxID=2047767 RepID=A0A6H1WUE6_9BACT|nr:dicarboxylate/amino acid:cation symporter [Thermosulfurimonas marina]QJA06822.1 dicarboxylate/amino acid:cation symporter [Thermosulfurimonas marina]